MIKTKQKIFVTLALILIIGITAAFAAPEKVDININSTQQTKVIYMFQDEFNKYYTTEASLNKALAEMAKNPDAKTLNWQLNIFVDPKEEAENKGKNKAATTKKIKNLINSKNLVINPGIENRELWLMSSELKCDQAHGIITKLEETFYNENGRILYWRSLEREYGEETLTYSTKNNLFYKELNKKVERFLKSQFSTYKKSAK